MPCAPVATPLADEVSAAAAQFYRWALERLDAGGVAFAVGGAFAHSCLTGIRRATKDLDLFIQRQDYERVATLLSGPGCRVEMTHPHWLAKAYGGPAGEDFIDLIFNCGNGLAPVDERWFQGNAQAQVLGVPVRLARVEDSLLSKAFIMERERYDGADIAHLLQAQAERLDWPRLVARFGPHWRVLLAHLVLFGYIYPAERQQVPAWVMERLAGRLLQEVRAPAPTGPPVCAGTLLSREQYLHDVRERGYLDARLTGASTMTPEDVAGWTAAIAAAPPARTDPAA